MLAALIALCSILFGPSSALPKNELAGDQISYCTLKRGDQFAQCPYTIAGYAILCESIPHYLADTACQSAGYRLAMPALGDWIYISSIYSLCTSAPYLLIDAYNGYAEDPCMVLSNRGVAIGGISNCGNLTAGAVLCQVIPDVTETVVATSTTTTTYGTLTETVAAYDPGHCRKQPDPPGPCDHCNRRGAVVEKSARQLPCPPVCSLELGNLHLILTGAISAAASAVCSAYGWTLADITTGSYSDAAAMMEACNVLADTVWINSYNGINSTCVMLSAMGAFDEPSAGFVLDATVCADLGLVLCQDSSAPPAITGTGPWIGTVSHVTQTTSTTTVTTLPSTTRTVTSYAAMRPTIPF